ncbi:MAG: hypothetical protein MMC33_005360 [Icmadophila ericetorum]|nr:hypothetical protein [Icmadophila ericetorum]
MNGPELQSLTPAPALHEADGKFHLLLAASGSVATIKIPNIVHALSDHPNLSIRILMTKSAKEFLQGQSHEQPHLKALLKMRNVDGIYNDDNEWAVPWIRNAKILHIELRRWADLLVVAPLSANTMAKMAAGISDNLLLSVIRAWDTSGFIDGKRKRVIVAPAMNTAMWMHPVTLKQLRILEEEWGIGGDNDGWIEVLRPVEKTLACGDNGSGAMRPWTEIVDIIKLRIEASSPTTLP